jgi:peptide/nickel transport system permease protein
VNRFLANRSAAIGALLVLAVIVVAAFAPWIGGDPNRLDVEHGLTQLGAPLSPGEHGPLGTDQLGRDVWARLAAGAGTSLGIAATATAIALAIGLLVGLVAGYAGGWVDTVLMRIVDLVLAFPYLLLAILLAALLRESGLGATSAPVIVTLGVVGWTTMARVVRNQTRSLVRTEMVVAARAIGASSTRIVVVHVLPNLAGVVIAIAVLAFAQNLLAESVLSYVGLGPAPPTATWGRMVYDGRLYYRTAPHLVLAPGLAIVAVVVGFQLLGDGLRELFDPSERGRQAA